MTYLLPKMTHPAILSAVLVATGLELHSPLISSQFIGFAVVVVVIVVVAVE